jgi:RNase adapter protein RapZ
VSTEPSSPGEASSAPDPPVQTRPELLVITGMSGAGRSRAAAALEDLGWYVVDNLPPTMLPPLAGMMAASVGRGGGVRHLAVVVDVRGGEFFSDLGSVLNDLRDTGISFRIIFLDSADEVLVRRFEAVRRPHPLQGHGRILAGIAAERRQLEQVRERADVVLDTSELTVHELTRSVTEIVAGPTERAMRLTLVSFGFKYGLPLDADQVVDVRFLANPYWVASLRELTGKDEAVSSYVLGLKGAETFLSRYLDAIEPVLDGYIKEQKPYVTIAVGCTGGKHRSVAIAEAMATRLRSHGRQVRVMHRDLGRE